MTQADLTDWVMGVMRDTPMWKEADHETRLNIALSMGDMTKSIYRQAGNARTLMTPTALALASESMKLIAEGVRARGTPKEG